MAAKNGFESIFEGVDFLNRLQEGAWVADERGTIVFANRALAGMLGYEDPVSLRGRPWRDMFPARETTRFVDAEQSEPGLRVVPDSSILTRDNRPLPASVALDRQSKNGITWYFGTVVRAQAGAAGSDATVGRQVMEQAADGICIVRQGNVVDANRRFEEMSGYVTGQVRDTPLAKLFIPADRDSVIELCEQARHVEKPAVHRVRLLTRAGGELECELRVVPVASDEGPSLLCFLRDLTRAQRAKKASTDFVAAVSHELRTPLASIKESVALAAESADPHLGERERRYLSIAQEEISRLNRMIANLLEASRMESGKLRLDLKQVEMAEVVERAVEGLSPIISRKKLEVNRQFPPGLPPVLGDSDRLVQVVSNLLDNAIKYTPSGGRISITGKPVAAGSEVLSEPGILPNTPYVQVTVSDYGPGIPAEFLDRIFGKFERVDPQGAGTGLGLANVRAIVELHYGRVWADSQLGQGSSFSFVLPVEEQR